MNINYFLINLIFFRFKRSDRNVTAEWRRAGHALPLSTSSIRQSIELLRDRFFLLPHCVPNFLIIIIRRLSSNVLQKFYLVTAYGVIGRKITERQYTDLSNLYFSLRATFGSAQ